LLSYRHSFHAGNFADVLKHIVLVEIFAYLRKKDKPFDYIDTHAGAGLYHLRSPQAEKLMEYADGIGRLQARDWPELTGYFAAIQAHNRPGTLTVYPGSAAIARHFLRAQDKAWLFELHATDFELLQNIMADDARVKVRHEDGFQGLLALLPPASRRGLVLIDPPYEIKTDYAQVVDTVIKAHKKAATLTYAVWYPVVERRRINHLERRFIDSGLRDIQRFELAVAPDSEGLGMTAAGMIVINPPWTLREKMSHLLPRLVAALKQNAGAFSKCDVLVGE
jgi:23S rRNA (adenine2030-N6)-methyltransferase